MNFLECMKLRYTTKKYDSGVKLDTEKIQEIEKILHLSPSSLNSQPWKFTIVSDQKIKEALAPFSFHNKEKVEDCSHLIVFSMLDNIELFEKQMAEYLPEYAVTYYNIHIKPLGIAYTKNWMDQQVHIALGVLLSACATMNIDTTPMGGIEPEKYDEILETSNDYKTLFAVALGKRSGEDRNQPSITPKKRLPIEKVISKK
ncbi:NAD(P)H-dependent oxidoreductase [Flavobacterium sediminis]|uniref:NAD(P)H-dependent oxidoreductase n=1 Tax=Flavobacterium sediminis TaxID=2201181 RepID=A0A2U8QTC8_9FLAO|nr:NAD(P)H-dependent oxidoreductase [Flavobacterium sediminis]AWM13136.1 NAD(P)H-dependent oxidoreductase [Flavobacterium sediminis]